MFKASPLIFCYKKSLLYKLYSTLILIVINANVIFYLYNKSCFNAPFTNLISYTVFLKKLILKIDLFTQSHVV